MHLIDNQYIKRAAYGEQQRLSGTGETTVRRTYEQTSTTGLRVIDKSILLTTAYRPSVQSNANDNRGIGRPVNHPVCPDPLSPYAYESIDVYLNYNGLTIC